VACIAVAIAVMGVPVSAARGQLPRSDARCRNGLGKGVTKLAKAVLRAQAKCHAARSAGQIPAGSDCNDPAQSPDLAKIQKAAAKLRDGALRRCAGASSPAELGYVTCPAPCGGSVSTYSELADCFTCVTGAWIGDGLETAYGMPTPVPLDAPTSQCQQAIGGALRTYLLRRMREQQRCQYRDDRFAIGADCRTADLRGKVADALAMANLDLTQCSDSALAGADSCATMQAAEQVCMQDVTEVAADKLFVAVYRPSELVPTPTATGTATETETPSMTATETTTPASTSTVTLTPTRTAASTATSTRTRTFTATPTSTAIPSNTRTETPTFSPIPTETITATNTATATVTATATRTPTNLPPIHVDVTPFPAQSTPPCLIFVHGKRTDTGTYTDWNQAYAYWVNGSDDFIRTATKNFTTPYYVVGYNGTQPYWEAQAAGELANEIVNATDGGADGGGNRCARTFADGGTFWLVGHSMAGSLIDYVLGNAEPSSPNYNLNGPYDTAAHRISLAITVAGTHRGSQGADFVCGGGNPLCSFFAQFIQSCDGATYWLRSADDVQVRMYADPPVRTVWLTGGYAAIIGASSCLSGEDDGVVQHASSYACDGSATAAYTNTNVCGNNSKQESSGFKNLDTAHENHDQSRNDSHSDDRQAIPDGVWICNGNACGPGSVTIVESTAAFVRSLY
jgi:hypothetical protein